MTKRAAFGRLGLVESGAAGRQVLGSGVARPDSFGHNTAGMATASMGIAARLGPTPAGSSRLMTPAAAAMAHEKIHR